MDYSIIGPIVLAILIGWFLLRSTGRVHGLRELDAEQFKVDLDLGRSSPLVLIDVREPGEFQRGHLPGAKNLPLSQLKSKVQSLPSDGSLHLYCQTGMRSKQAARMLAREGYKDIVHLRGGIGAWQRAGYRIRR